MESGTVSPSSRATPSASLNPSALSDDELLRELQRLQQENAALEAQAHSAEEDHKHLVEKMVKIQQCAELEEDAIANSLLKKVEHVRREVKSYRGQIRCEEASHQELRDHIVALRKEQVTIENMMEQEQEFLVNQLRKELLATHQRKAALEADLAMERKAYLELLQDQLAVMQQQQQQQRPRSNSNQPSPALSVSAEPRPSLLHLTSMNTQPPAVPPVLLASSSGCYCDHPSPSLSSSASPTPLHGSVALPAASTNVLKSAASVTHGHNSTADVPSAAPSNVNSADVPLSASMTSVVGHVAAAACAAREARSPSVTSTSGVYHIPPLIPPRMVTPCRTPLRRTIPDLESEINHLLQEQVDCLQRAKEQEQAYEDLLDKLHAVQQDSFLDRAKVVRLNEELQQYKLKLEQLHHQHHSPCGDGGVASQFPAIVNRRSSHHRTPSQSLSESGAEFQQPAINSSITGTPLHIKMLRHRTKELLSTPRTLPIPRHRDPSVASDCRESPCVGSGYSSGTDVRGRSDSQTRGQQRAQIQQGEPLRLRNWSTTSHASGAVGSAQQQAPPIAPNSDAAVSNLPPPDDDCQKV